MVAYALWGLVAAYWKLLADVSPIELIAHRAIWGLVVFVAIAVAFGQGPGLRAALGDLRLLGVMTLTAALLAANWGLFVWATVSGHLLDASLGYFINPLVSIALGTLVLGERLRRLQWFAIGLAAIGVAMLTWRVGALPWISLVLAFTFGIYGLLRKVARIDALVGSAVETIVMAPAAIAYLVAVGGGTASSASPGTWLLLMGTGAITAVPLVLFTSSARQLPLTVVGFLQYLAPTGQFLLATIAYGEPLADRLFAFAWIWAGLAVFSLDLARQSSASPPVSQAATSEARAEPRHP